MVNGASWHDMLGLCLQACTCTSAASGYGLVLCCPVFLLTFQHAVYGAKCCSKCFSNAAANICCLFEALQMCVGHAFLTLAAVSCVAGPGSTWAHGSVSTLGFLSASATAAAVTPCSSLTSSIQSSSAFSHARSASTQAPLMRMQQQQQDQQGDSSSSKASWGKLIAGGAAAAVAAAAGWAVWSDSEAARRAQVLAEESNRGSLPRCSVATQVC